jgi:hypothetical protein
MTRLCLSRPPSTLSRSPKRSGYPDRYCFSTIYPSVEKKVRCYIAVSEIFLSTSHMQVIFSMSVRMLVLISKKIGKMLVAQLGIPSAQADNLGTIVPPITFSDHKKLPKLNFACQNVCSLNISKPNKKTHSKLITVTRSGADVKLLSDTRLNSDKQIAGVNDIEKKIRFMGYSFYHNSKKNSRGTAVLISKRINYEITDTFCDANCNMLLLKIVIGNISLTLGSIYGPNDDDENFFNQLGNEIDRFNSDFIILGGGLKCNL